jgi:group I intron endonuclease
LLRKGRHGNRHLQSAFVKYKERSFVYLILERTNDLNKRESFWIKFFGGMDGGKIYNKSSGGENGFTRSKETKDKCSRWQIGRKLSKTHIENIIKANKGVKKHTQETKDYLSNLYKGRPLTEETKAKISASKIGRKMPEEQRLKRMGQGSRPVVQFDKGGNKISEFNSAKDAGDSLGFWKSDITQCCMGNRKTVSGFIFKYK